MACFSDLPFELQTDIWTLALPYRGGVHWVDFEGHPHSPDIVNKSLQWNQDLFGGIEPDSSKNLIAEIRNPGYRKHCKDLDETTLFFKSLYTTVPSVYGQSRVPPEHELPQDVMDEIDDKKRCRQLSTYTQIATLLSICQTSRLAALDHLQKMKPNIWFPLYRSAGHLYRYVVLIVVWE